ncbi:unnamed protein product [Schistosoma margrebowiei]|uniref:Uncharacterized protein n=1 Tax=Schistosoma margrebowiei TaxID=48269 RepID=A0A183MZC2_9TREM|nr:unnamed protein product [Schistosoma margrebowiei]
MLLYSGDGEENAPHISGIALSNESPKASNEWKSHGSRIIKASLKTKQEGITMNVIQCYAPTDDMNDDNKDQFHE